MGDLLPFVVSGLASGAIYGLAGSGLVLTYRTSGILNFGHGAIAAAAAYLFYWLTADRGVPWGIALFASVFVAGPLLGLLMEQISRVLATQITSLRVVATIGIVVAVQGFATAKYGTDPLPVPHYLPKARESIHIAGTNVMYATITIAVVATVCVGLLSVMLRATRVGTAMRAVVDDPDLLAMRGVRPAFVQRWAWVIGSTFASLSGVLIIPMVGLDAVNLTFLIVMAFGAAAIGLFSSLVLTFGGGLLIGVLADVSTKYVIDFSWLGGVPPSIPFLVLFVVLLLVPRRYMRVADVEKRAAITPYEAPPRVRMVAVAVVLGVFVLIPQIVGNKLPLYTTGLTKVILLLSLGLLVRIAGQISLCHAAFAAIGAVTFSQLAVGAELPWLVALVGAALVAVPIGAIVAAPAVRLSGVFLALSTLGFGLLVERLFFPLSFMFTTEGEGRRMPRPSIAEGDTAYYYLVLVAVIVIAAGLELLIKSRLGRLSRAMSESPIALAAGGLNANSTRVIVFCISAAIASVAGALYGSSIHFASSVDPYYTSFGSLILLVTLAIAPFGHPWYALVAVASTVIPGYYSSDTVTSWMNVLFGLSAIGVAMSGGPVPMGERLRARLDRFGVRPTADGTTTGFERSPLSLASNGDAVATGVVGAVSPRPDGTGLKATGISVRFGGLVAVDGVSLDVPVGRITGLIGPNGAGKTVTFNACSGFVRAASGKVELNGVDLSGRDPASRARAGIGRTFQHIELVPSFTVRQNVELGREAGFAGEALPWQIVAPAQQRHDVAEAAQRAIELCQIADIADARADTLSTGQRRLVELARCLAGRFEVLLLDEPSAGLDRDETARFGAILRRAVELRGYGVLLVEHDMSLVLSVCDYIYVLDAGKPIFQGVSTEVADSAVVRKAYLGETDLALLGGAS